MNRYVISFPWAKFVGISVMLTAAFIWLSFMFLDSHASVKMVTLMSQARQVGRGLLIYAEASDGRLPPADRWAVAVKPDDPLKFRFREGTRYCFAFNRKLSGIVVSNIPNPSTIGLAFSTTKNERNASDNFESIRWTVFRRGFLVVTLDGGVRRMNRGDHLGPSPLNGPLRSLD